MFDLKQQHGDVRQLRAAVSRSAAADGKAAQIDMPGVPLGSFAGSTYDEFDARPRGRRRVRVLLGRHLRGVQRGRRRSSAPVASSRSWNAPTRQSAKEIVGAIFGAVQAFRGDAEQTDDQTVVVVKITA